MTWGTRLPGRGRWPAHSRCGFQACCSAPPLPGSRCGFGSPGSAARHPRLRVRVGQGRGCSVSSRLHGFCENAGRPSLSRGWGSSPLPYLTLGGMSFPSGEWSRTLERKVGSLEPGARLGLLHGHQRGCRPERGGGLAGEGGGQRQGLLGRRRLPTLQGQVLL